MEGGWMTALELVTQARVIPVLRGDDPLGVIELGKVLFEEGLKALEVTFTVPDAPKVIRELAGHGLVGAGTVIDLKQYRVALKAGARFVVSPGVDLGLLEFAQDHDRIPYLPGVFTPSEVMTALGYGFKVQKLFPGELAGTRLLRSLRGPFPQVRFMPTGGVSSENLSEWVSAGAVAVGMGSNLTGGSLEEVRQRVRELKSVLKRLGWEP
jgi:2-dehydro-3-deoxyphosphogluconate aldolase/(4S)-4-hydroxy-2-oxoglutarate aldolase